MSSRFLGCGLQHHFLEFAPGSSLPGLLLLLTILQPSWLPANQHVGEDKNFCNYKGKTVLPLMAALFPNLPLHLLHLLQLPNTREVPSCRSWDRGLGRR